MIAALRTATREDAACIADIYLASRAVFLPYAWFAHSDCSVRAWVRDILLPREDVTVASVADQVVGFMAIHAEAGISWITQLYCTPSHVDQGIGTGLLARAMETASRPIRLYTFQQNTGARRFYERNGFAAIGFTDGGANEERCPDVLYELAA
jgi:GNAT superfamily N-acetyltransferase